MVSGFRGTMAAASTIATCKTQQIGLTNIALPQFPQPRQIFQKRPLPVGPALPGPNYTSNLAHLAGIPLPMPAVSMARQQGVLTRALPTFEEIGDSRHQGRGQKLRHSGRRGGSLKPNRTFVMTRTPMTNRSRGNCKRTEVRSLLTPISCLGLSTWLGGLSPRYQARYEILGSGSPPFHHGEFSVRFRASCEASAGTCHATLLCGLCWLIIPHYSTGYI